MTVNPWKTLSTEVKYDNPWIKVSEDKVIRPDGKDGIYGTVHFKNLAIGVLALDKDLNTWIVGQYRYPLKDYCWEIPEGGGDLKISPIETAKRELKEETGITAKNFKEILRMHLSNSVSDELSISYVATDLTFGIAEPDPDEILQVKKLPFLELYEMTLQGKITDSISVATILKAKILIDLGQLHG